MWEGSGVREVCLNFSANQELRSEFQETKEHHDGSLRQESCLEKYQKVNAEIQAMNRQCGSAFSYFNSGFDKTLD